MRNFFKPLTETTQQFCKSKTVIEVNSNRYNDDENYQKSIDESLKRVCQLKNK